MILVFEVVIPNGPTRSLWLRLKDLISGAFVRRSLSLLSRCFLRALLSLLAFLCPSIRVPCGDRGAWALWDLHLLFLHFYVKDMGFLLMSFTDRGLWRRDPPGLSFLYPQLVEKALYHRWGKFQNIPLPPFPFSIVSLAWVWVCDSEWCAGVNWFRTKV